MGISKKIGDKNQFTITKFHCIWLWLGLWLLRYFVNGKRCIFTLIYLRSLRPWEHKARYKMAQYGPIMNGFYIVNSLYKTVYYRTILRVGILKIAVFSNLYFLWLLPVLNFSNRQMWKYAKLNAKNCLPFTFICHIIRQSHQH